MERQAFRNFSSPNRISSVRTNKCVAMRGQIVRPTQQQGPRVEKIDILKEKSSISCASIFFNC